jgi:hypothetical protein
VEIGNSYHTVSWFAEVTAVADVLPPEIAQGATLRGNEYGWSIPSFPDALAKAKDLGFACLGGQFQFRLEDGSTCEMYWIEADSTEQLSDESWADYSRRSCSEVLNRFHHLVSAIDFRKEAASWPSGEIDSTKSLVFVAYFVKENDLAATSPR